MPFVVMTDDFNRADEFTLGNRVGSPCAPHCSWSPVQNNLGVAQPKPDLENNMVWSQLFVHQFSKFTSANFSHDHYGQIAWTSSTSNDGGNVAACVRMQINQTMYSWQVTRNLAAGHDGLTIVKWTAGVPAEIVSTRFDLGSIRVTGGTIRLKATQLTSTTVQLDGYEGGTLRSTWVDNGTVNGDIITGGWPGFDIVGLPGVPFIDSQRADNFEAAGDIIQTPIITPPSCT